jgi:hypothetical protein
MSFEIEGKLHKKFETESKTATFQAREFVIYIEDGNYPQYIKFQLTQDRCSLIDNYNEGDIINVTFDLRGREWNEKYFTNLNAWKIEKAVDESVSPPEDIPFPDEDQMPVDPDFENNAGQFEDDLPF